MSTTWPGDSHLSLNLRRATSSAFLLLLALASIPVAGAADTTEAAATVGATDQPPASPGPGLLELITPKLSTDLFLAGGGQQPLYDSLYNPGNTLLQYPETAGFAEARLNAELRLPAETTITLRPRAHVALETAPQLGTSAQSAPYGARSLTDLYFTEAMISSRPMDFLALAVGRQNYQWGPAESVSPTNVFFPEILVLPMPFSEIIGKTMARANLSFGGQWSWILMGELPPLPDHDYQSPGLPAEMSQQRVESKLEYNWDNGAHYVGAVLARRTDPDRARGMGGGYFSFTLSDAWQVYSDAMVSDGAVVPVYGGGSALVAELTRTGPQLYSVEGARYTFPGGTEIRLEHIFNQAGYTPSEEDGLKAGLANPMAVPGLLSALSEAGLALPGRNYLYTGVRSSSDATFLKFLRQPTAALHALVSLTDASSTILPSLEAGLSERFTGYLYGGLSPGSDNSELRRYVGYFGGAAVRLSL